MWQDRHLTFSINRGKHAAVRLDTWFIKRQYHRTTLIGVGLLAKCGIAALAFVSVFSTGVSLALGASSSPERRCQAADAAVFGHCVDLANHEEVDLIVVTSQIRCGPASPCKYLLRGIIHPFAIIGGTEEAGFSQEADSGASFGLRIEKASGPIVIRGLQFDMGRSATRGMPGEIWTDMACPMSSSCPSEAIAIVDSANVLVDQVKIENAKLFGIAIVGSSNITIRRSAFLRSDLHGIWVARTPASRGLHVENNQFIDIRSNGAMLSGAPPDNSDTLGTNTITGNLFDHDHYAAVYHVCGPSGHDPCAGGELIIEQQSKSFMIADNEFRHGVLDEDPSLARVIRVSGIEVAPAGVYSVMIRHNYFHNLSAGAVSVDAPTVAPQLKVIDNTFEYVGGLDAAIGEARALGENLGNCQSEPAHCEWARPTGRLVWVTCGPTGAQESSATVRWNAQNIGLPMRIIADGRRVLLQLDSVIGRDQIGPQTSLDSLRLDLYSGATLLDTVGPCQ